MSDRLRAFGGGGTRRVWAGLRTFGAFWWDFVVGDDWRVGVGVIAALAITYAISRASAPAWWVMPVAVVALLGLTLRWATRGSP